MLSKQRELGGKFQVRVSCSQCSHLDSSAGRAGARGSGGPFLSFPS